MISNQLDRIIFVPVIHTDTESIDRARDVVREIRPDVVAVELDRQRYHQLMNQNPEDSVPNGAATGNVAEDLMLQIALLEKSLGETTGASAGAEMMAAIEEGRKIGCKIALVDRPIQETLQAIMQVPLDEIYRLTGMFPGVTQEIEEEDTVDLFAMLKDNEAVSSMMSQFETDFPGLYDALINQRDRYVANALFSILNDVEGKIVAILGAGHIEGVTAHLIRILSDTAGS